MSLDWNFGDTTPIVHCPGDPACTSAGITTHNFAFVGTFNVNLVVRDSAGRIGAKTASVPVSPPGPIAALNLFKTGGNGIQADASASVAVGGATIVEYPLRMGRQHA